MDSKGCKSLVAAIVTSTLQLPTGDTMTQLNLYDLKQVGEDFIVVSDGTTDVKITFADTPPGMDFINLTKEEHAAFFKNTQSQVGLEAPVLTSTESRTMRIFLDHSVVGYGVVRSTPFPFPVTSIEVAHK
jgi:hypothetical protein